MKYECRADEFVLLKRLDNGQYINLSDLDFESSHNANNMYYDLDQTAEYVLMFCPMATSTNWYVPVDDIEVLVQYAPSIKKIKRVSIADVIIAKLMNENNSLYYTIEYDGNKNESTIKMFLKILRDNNSRTDVEYVTEFTNATAEAV